MQVDPNEPSPNTNHDINNHPKSLLSDNNKKLLLGALAGIGVLLLILIILVAQLLGKKDQTAAGDTSNSSDSSTTQSSEGTTSSNNRKVIRTVPSPGKPKIEYLIYEPRQTGSNTTIDYAIRNKCDGCNAAEYGSLSVSNSNTYLLDEAAGRKYNLILDEDDRPLATSSCSAYLNPGEMKLCFAAFSKVPSGTIVSLVLNDLKIDDIKIK